MNKELAKLIIAQMESEGLTQSAVALNLGVSATAVANWRKGSTPQSGLLAPLAAILKVDPGRFAAIAGRSPWQASPAHLVAGGLAERLVALAATMPPKRLEQLLTYAEFLGDRKSVV